MKRIFIDAPPNVRCDTRVSLSRTEYAQCGRRQSQQCCKVCTQHRKMVRDGKTVIDFHTGVAMTSIIDQKKR